MNEFRLSKAKVKAQVLGMNAINGMSALLTRKWLLLPTRKHPYIRKRLDCFIPGLYL